MKRQFGKEMLILAVLSMWFCGEASAQTCIGTAGDLQSSYWGFKAGLVSSKTQFAASYRLPSNMNLQYRILYTVGGYYAHRIVGSFYIQAELLYAVKGVKFHSLHRDYYYVGMIELTENQTLNYLELPILFNYVLKDSFIKPSVYAGVFGAHLLKVESDLGYDISNEFKSTDYGAIFGLAALVPIHGRNFIFEGRFAHSFDNIIKDGFCSAEADHKSSSFSFMAGIAF